MTTKNTTTNTSVLANGISTSGLHIHAEQTGSGQFDVTIQVNGEVVDLVGQPSVLRDGGSRAFLTTAGMLFLSHKIDGDRSPLWDGEPLSDARSNAPAA